MATNEVVRDNVRTVTIGSMTLEVEASPGAGIVYRNEFVGRLDSPYRGLLSDDMLLIWRQFRPTVEEDGEEVPNPDYVGLDMEALLRLTWAMARAAGSTKKGWKAFYEDVIHQPMSVFEESSLYATVILELGGGVIFRRPDGRVGAGAPDEKEA